MHVPYIGSAGYDAGMTEENDTEWTVAELLIALIFGRSQYTPTQQLQMRVNMPFWVYMWGQSGTAKTVIAMVLAQFFSTCTSYFLSSRSAQVHVFQKNLFLTEKPVYY
eukprot:COSAG05_NODE_5792_length_1086_cov_15.440729_1_plen_108_part_00